MYRCMSLAQEQTQHSWRRGRTTWTRKAVGRLQRPGRACVGWTPRCRSRASPPPSGDGWHERHCSSMCLSAQYCPCMIQALQGLDRTGPLTGSITWYYIELHAITWWIITGHYKELHAHYRRLHAITCMHITSNYMHVMACNEHVMSM